MSVIDPERLRTQIELDLAGSGDWEIEEVEVTLPPLDFDQELLASAIADGIRRQMDEDAGS
jgi:hypothetical protein